MTNNVTQNFIEGAIKGFADFMAPLTAFSYAVNQDGAVLGDTVTVPFVATTTASSAFTYANGYSGDNGSVNGKSVTLNIQLYQPIKLTDADMGKLSPEVLNRLGQAAGARLAADFQSASFASVISDTNYPTSGSATSTAYGTSSTFTALDKLANDAKWPDYPNRFIVAGTTLWKAILDNPNLNMAYAYGDGSVVQRGVVNDVYGFIPYKTTVTLPNSAKGFAANPNAMAIAMAWHKPGPDAKGIVESVKAVDTTSGVVIGYRRFYDALHASTYQILEVLGGVALADPTALIQIK